LLACAYLGTFGGAAYLQHSAVVTKIGWYIRDVIRPIIDRIAGHQCFEWEIYHRTDKGAIGLRKLQYRARNITNAIVFGGSISVGLVAPAVSMVRRLIQHDNPWVLAWEAPLWFLALASAIWILLSLRQREVLQLTPRRQRYDEEDTAAPRDAQG
jgi:hypothetical protein